MNPTGQVALTAGTTSSSVALGSVGPTALVTNNGTVTAYINFGGSGVVATTSSYPVNAGQSVAFSNGSNTYVAAITASGSAPLAITTGTGVPAIAGGGSGGGGGNTVAPTAAGTSATTANPVQGVTGGVPMPVSPPSGTPNDDGTAALGTSSTPIVSALSTGQSRKALYIALNTSGATVWCNPYGGTAVAGDAHDIQVNQYLNFAAIGFIPNGAVNCISSVANTVLAVYEAH